MTLLSAIEQIAISAKDSALCEKFFKQNTKQILYITQRLQINEREAVILAVLANFYNEWNSISDLAHYVDCHRLHMLYSGALHTRRAISLYQSSRPVTFFEIGSEFPVGEVSDYILLYI